MKKGHYKEIHLARALTLLLVVLGHSLPGDGSVSRGIVRVIYSFHMGTFFFLSGFVAAPALLHPEERPLSAELLKRVKRLLVPYLFFSLCTLLMKMLFADVVSNPVREEAFFGILTGNTPNGALWFLWTLFVMACLFLLIGRVLSGWYVYFAAGCVCYVLYLLLPVFFLTPVLQYALYYALGICVQHGWDVLRPRWSGHRGMICGVLCLAAVPVLCLGFSGIPYAVTCLSGTTGILCVGIFLSERKDGPTAVLTPLADYSYDIYLLSYFVQQPVRLLLYGRLPYVAVVLLMFFAGLIVPYLLSRYLLRKSALCRRVMFGMQ